MKQRVSSQVTDNRIHQEGVTAPAGGKHFGGQKLELGHGRVTSLVAWAGLIEKEANGMQAEGRGRGGEQRGGEWKWGEEEAFSSLATLFLAQEKTGRLLVLVYPTLRKGCDPHPMESGLGHGGLVGHQSEGMACAALKRPCLPVSGNAPLGQGPLMEDDAA